MIVILEGPDGGGKTQLADALRQRMQQSRVVHTAKHGPYTGVAPADLCRIYFRAMTPALTHDEHVIMDRSWVSESIYGDVYRSGVNRVDMQRRRMLERIALSRGAVLVVCQPPFENCAKTFLLREKDEYLDNLSQLKAVYEAYDSLGQNMALPFVHYDYTRDNVDTLLGVIKERSIVNKAAGGGCFKEGNILLLCDKGPKTNMRASALVIPFINFLDNDGPSRMLVQTLENEGVLENKVYWINTQTFQGVPTSPDFITQLKPSKIFALGNNAYAWALNNNVRVTKLPPPLHHMQNYSDQPYHIMGYTNGNC